MPNFVNTCQQMTDELSELVSEKEALKEEINNSEGKLRELLQRQSIQFNRTIAEKRQELYRCQHPSGPKPDLLAQTVQINKNHAERKLNVAPLIVNIGSVDAYGPFKIDLAVTWFRGGITTSAVTSLMIPQGVVIPGGNTSQSVYVAEYSTFPLYYRDEAPSATYEIEYIVDVDQILSESVESNNHFFIKYWGTSPSPSFAERVEPFIFELEP